MKRILTLISFVLLCGVLPATLPAQQTTSSAKSLTHTYKLTYTLIVSDAGKRTGDQHFVMTVGAPTNTSNFKTGEKVPVIAASYNSAKGDSGLQTQFTYLDVGLYISATLSESPNGLELTSKIEQSSVAPVPAKLDGVNEPVLRQLTLSNNALLAPGKTVTIGSFDVPDTTRHVDITVAVEQLP